MINQLVLNVLLTSSYSKRIANRHVLQDITKIQHLDGVLNADVIALLAQAMMFVPAVLVFQTSNPLEYVQSNMDKMLLLFSNYQMTISLLN